MSILAPNRPRKTVSGVRNVAVSFANVVDSGELLTGTPTITGSPSGLTFANQAVNTAALTINGESVAIGNAVQFKVAGGTADTEYTILVQVSTDATPAQTFYDSLKLLVVAD